MPPAATPTNHLPALSAGGLEDISRRADLELRAETRGMLLRGCLYGAGSGLLFCPVFGLALFGVAWPPAFAAWAVVAMGASLLLCLGLWRRLQGGHPQPGVWTRRDDLRWILLLAAYGGVWGVTGVLFYADDPQRLAVLSVMALANVFSVMAGGAVHMPSALAYGVFSALPFAWMAGRSGDPLAQIAALSVVAMTVLMSLHGRRVSIVLHRNIRMRHENRLLGEALTEQRVRERTRVLEAASRHKSEFLAGMSHELRTPLNAIIGYSEMLQEEAAERGATSMLPDLQRITAAGRHLLDLITAVLDLSRIESGRMEADPGRHDLRRLVEEVVAIVEPLAARQGNRLEVLWHEAPGSVWLDGLKLRQMLLNLLGNAAKFTEGGLIRLELHGLPGPPQRLVCQVTDTGRGMTPEQLSRLFEDFVQVDPEASRKHGGSGLGLSLSRRLARLMGGDITVRSTRGRGSRFTLTLPCGALPEPAAPQAAASP